MEERKTLVKQLRDMVELSIESNQYPTVHADAIIGHLCVSKSDVRELLTTIADRIEREYMPLPLLEGEPLKIGDKVDGYSQEGAEVIAIMNSNMIVVRSTVKGGHGYHDEAYPLLLWSVDELKRHRQEVLDADGVPIHVGDTVYSVHGGPKAIKVASIDVSDDWPITSTELQHFKPSKLTHKQPDSLERIERDALMDSIIYCDKYGLLDSRCNAEEGDGAVRHCTDCGLSCETRMVKHILRRQREVLERGQA